jgi:hypothetical protein
MGLTRIRAQQISDIDYKQACRAVATTNVTLSGGAPATVDGVGLQLLDRVLVTGQNTASENGFYFVETVGQGENGTWARTTDANETGEIAPGMIVMVTEGEVYADTQWKLTTNGTVIVGTTDLNFVLNAVSVIGGSNTQIQYNAGGTLAGSANLTFANNELTVIGQANVSGNITTGNILTDGYYYANGEPFVAGSNYGDANVATFLGTEFGSNSISTTGNITANYFVGNGSQLTGISGGSTTISSGTSNVDIATANADITMSVAGISNVMVVSTNGITVQGNVVGNGIATTTISSSPPENPEQGDIWIDSDTGVQLIYFNDGNSSQWAEMEAATSISFGSELDLSAVAQDIIPSANVTYDLGTPSQRWRDIYLANSTIYLGAANISSSAEGSLTLPSAVSIGSAVLDATSGTLSLPSTVNIGNSAITESSGTITLPANTAIGGATVATPRISSIDYPGDDTAADPAGGQTLGIVGSGFQNGAAVILDGATMGVVTFVSSTRLEITSPVKSTGSYTLYVINPDGGTGIFVPGVQYSGVPTWSSPAAGSLSAVYETANVSQTFVATSDSAVSYSLHSGTLPPGTTLNANTGVLSGTANLTAGNSVTYTFTVSAVDAEQQNTERAFSLTIDVDAVSWSSPTDGNVISIIVDQASSTTLDAASAAGDTITYSANALPVGLALSGDTISGTANTIANTSVAITATADTTTRSATITVTFVVALPLGDEYFNQTTLLLNGDTDTFITDASDNAFTITPQGDTRPSAFSPYNTSWSNYFDGNGDFLSLAAADALSFGTGDFTVEGWFNASIVSGQPCLLGIGGDNNGLVITFYGTAIYAYFVNAGGVFGSGNAIITNRWYHFAWTRSSGVNKFFLNGTQDGNNYTNPGNHVSTGGVGIGDQVAGTNFGSFTGYISNIRVVKGTALYTANFTPPTEPLTAISGTSLLTCQSNRFRDASTNNFAITRNGDVKVTSFGPFTDTDTSTGSSLYVSDATDACQIADNDNLSFTSTDDFTLECWVYHLGHRTYNYFFSKGISSTREYAFATTGSSMFFYWQQGGDQTITHSYTFLLNTWYHLAYTNTGGNLRFFINGELVKTQAWSGVITNTVHPAWIGSFLDYRSIAHSFYGYLSDLRFIKGEALYTSSFAVPTAPRTNETNTQLLTHQNRVSYNNSQPIDESGIRNIITRNGNSSAGTFSPHVPTGWSGYFDGTGDYLTAPTNAAFSFDGNFTVETWLYPTAFSNYKGIYSNTNAINSTGFHFGLNANGNIFIYYNGGFVVTSSNAMTLNAWNHVAVVRNSGVVYIYINGSVSTNSWTTSASFTNAACVIGTNPGPGTEYYFGYISNLRIVKGTAVYTGNFTPPTAPLEPIASTSLLTLRGPSFTDDGPGRFAITRAGDTKITAFSPFAPNTVTPDSYSVYFDGTGDYLTTPNNDVFKFGTGDFTVECWFTISTAKAYACLVNLYDGGGWYLALDATGTKLFGAVFGPAVYLTSTSTVSDGAWHHVAMTRSGTTLSLFVDGVREVTVTNSYNITSTSALDIGRLATFPRDWPGNISNLRIIKGSGPYDATQSTITVPTSPLTAIANTSLLTCQSPTVVDNSSNAFAITVNGNSQPTRFNPFGETVTAGVEYAPASHGGSVYFDGSGDYLSSGTSTAYTLGTGDFTIEAWLYNFGYAGTQYGRGWCTLYSTAGNYMMLRLNTGSDHLNMWMYLAPSVYFNNYSTALITPYSWTHVAFVRQSGTFKLYINGTLDTTISGVTVGLDHDRVEIGRNDNGYPLGDWNGYISNHRIVKGTAVYTGNFTPPTAPTTPIAGTTLLINGTNAAIQDRTGRNVLETVGNARTLPESPYRLNKSVYFDGTGDYLDAGSNAAFQMGTGDFTYECWVYHTSVSGQQTYFSDQFGNQAGVYFFKNTSNFPGVYYSSQIATSSIAVTAGQWYHLVASRASGTLKIFVNGVQGASVSDTTNLTQQTQFIGGDTGSGSMLGYISNARIVKGTAVYTTNFTPPIVPLTAIANTSLLTCQSYNFKDNSTNNFTITRNGDASISSRGPFTETETENNSMYFDGTGDGLVGPTSNLFDFGSGNFTIEFWANIPSTSGNGFFVSVWETVGGSDANSSWLIRLNNNGTLITHLTQGTGTFNTLTSEQLTTNTWFHCAYTRNGNTIYLFINGVLSQSASVSGSMNTVVRPLRVGYQNGGNPLTGYIDDLRITKGVARYTSNFTPPSEPFPLS